MNYIERLERLKEFEVFFEKGNYYFEFEECGISYSREEILEMNGCYDYIEEIVNEELEESDLKFDEVVEVLSIKENYNNRQGEFDVVYKVKLMFQNIAKETLFYNYDEDEKEEIENNESNVDNIMHEIIATDLNGINTFNESYYVDKKNKQVIITVYYEEY